MNSPDSPPRIITFYSYKGGTGRSMALANVAWILASNRKRVLVLDWDLEAPGLHRYFHPFLRDKNLSASEGIIDFVIDFAMEAVTPGESSGKDWYLPYANIVRYASSLNWDFPAPGTLDFISAGRQGPDYATRVNSFNWEKFYEHLGGGLFLEAVKQSMAGYDYVLIDSRTGVSDTSGICTIQMPDHLVVCFTLNSQSIEGAAAVAESAHQQRLRPNGEPGLKIFPVPTRIDLSEKQKLDLAEDEARERFQQFLWHIPVDSHAAYWGSVRVLYHSFYAYEELLATFGDKPLQTQSVLSSMEAITQYLTDSTVRQFPPLEESSRQELLEKYLRKPKPVVLQAHRGSWIFYFSYSRSDRDEYLKKFFEDLSHELRLILGLPIDISVGFFDQEIEVEENWSTRLGEALRTSPLLISTVSPGYVKSEWCGKEFAVFQQRQRLTLEKMRDITAILPICWIPVKEGLPSVLQQIQFLTQDFPSSYAEVGLRQMIRLRRYREDYQEAVSLLAEQVRRTYNNTILPVLDSLPEPEKLRSAFDDYGHSGIASSISITGGPRQVDLIYAVAGPEEMRGIRINLDRYGKTGEGNWFPFLPEVKYEISIFVANIINSLGLFVEHLPFSANLIQQIAEAEQRNEIVILVVDPWSLKLLHYGSILQQFDRMNFLNCAVLILWGKEDQETAQYRSELQNSVREIFQYRSLSKDLYFRDLIQSETEFKKELEVALQAIRLRLIERAQVLRGVGSSSPVGIPSITGPSKEFKP